MSSGKVILLGEHGVVYGRRALACGISRGVTARATRADGWSLAVSPWGVSVAAEAGSEEPLARAFAAVVAGYGAAPPQRVEADVELPAGAGLGCSAALGVAVIEALDVALSIERDCMARAEASLAWERVFHGNPSGVDGAMAACGGIAVFRRGAPLERVKPRAPVTLVVGHSGESASTREMVEGVARLHARATARIDGVFDGIEALVTNGRSAVAAGDLAELGMLLTLNQVLLNTLLVSTARLEELCATAREAGALGAKLTGSGGGGCMIALVDGDAARDRVVAALDAMGARPFVAEVRA